MRDLHAIVAELQAALIDAGALQQPVQLGTIVLNMNDGRLSNVHVNAVHRVQGKPRQWRIPERTGTIRRPYVDETGFHSGDNGKKP